MASRAQSRQRLQRRDRHRILIAGEQRGHGVRRRRVAPRRQLGRQHGLLGRRGGLERVSQNIDRYVVRRADDRLAHQG